MYFPSCISPPSLPIFNLPSEKVVFPEPQIPHGVVQTQRAHAAPASGYHCRRAATALEEREREREREKRERERDRAEVSIPFTVETHSTI